MKKAFEQELYTQAAQEPFTAAETARIIAMAKQKMAANGTTITSNTGTGTGAKICRSTTQPALSTIPSAPSKKNYRSTTLENHSSASPALRVVEGGAQHQPIAAHAKHLPRRSFFVAAAIAAMAALCGFGLLTRMGEGEIPFFAKESNSIADGGVTAPLGNHTATQSALESYNATLGETITQDGVTLTYDTLSMDGSQLNLFYTIQSEQLQKDWVANAFGDADNYYPDWLGIQWAAPDLICTITDATGHSSEIYIPNAINVYRADETSLTVWNSMALPTSFEGDFALQFRLEFPEQLGVTDNSAFDYSFSVDESALAGSKTAAAQEIVFGDRTLPLEQLAFGALGGSATLRSPADDANYYYDLGGFALTDSTGKEIYPTQNYSDSMTDGKYNYSYLLSALGEGADSITITPVTYGEGFEKVTVTTAELKDGMQIATSPIGGFTVQNFTQEGSIISYQLVPYGYNSISGDLLLSAEDNALVSLTADARKALISRTVDASTGVLTERIDYYAATPEEVASIPTWEYYTFPSLAYDTENAVTLPLA